MQTGIEGLTQITNGLQEKDFVKFAQGLVTIVSAFAPVLGPLGAAFGFLGPILGLGGSANKEIIDKLGEISKQLDSIESKIDDFANIVQEENAKTALTERLSRLRALLIAHTHYVSSNSSALRNEFNKQCGYQNPADILTFLELQISETLAPITFSSSLERLFLLQAYKRYCNMDNLMKGMKLIIGTFVQASVLHAACFAVQNTNTTHTIDEKDVLKQTNTKQLQLNGIHSSLKSALNLLAEGSKLKSCVESDIRQQMKLSSFSSNVEDETNETFVGNSTNTYSNAKSASNLKNFLSQNYSWRKWNTIMYDKGLVGFDLHTVGCTGDIKNKGLCLFYKREFNKNLIVVSPSYTKSWNYSILDKCTAPVIISTRDCHTVYKQIEACTKDRPTAASACWHDDSHHGYKKTETAFGSNAYFSVFTGSGHRFHILAV